MAAPRPRPAPASPEALIAGLKNEDRRADAGRVLALMAAATGRPARLSDTGTIGFGETRPGPAPAVAFSPRSRELVFYGLTGHPRSEELLARLGRHRRGPDRLYVKRLEELDEDVLAALVAHAFERSQGGAAEGS